MPLDEPNPRAVLGGNKPPVVDPDLLAAFRAKLDERAATAGDWLDLRRIESDEDASRANDFLSAIKALRDEIDAKRKELKAPHDEAAKAVQAAFAGLLDPLAFTDGAVRRMLTGFAETKRRAEEQARADALASAEAEAAAARKALEDATARNDVIGISAAEHGLEAAEKALAKLTKAKPVKVQIASATGGGRTRGERVLRRAVLENTNKAFMHYRDAPELREVLERLATADVRAAKGAPIQIPGFTIQEERTVS